MSLNRPTDLTNAERRSFGLQYPNNDFILGTRGDVHTFFLSINDLIKVNMLKNEFSTISFDLYRSFIGSEKLDKFKREWPLLRDALSEISPDRLDWTHYPYNKTKGQFDYQQKIFNLEKRSIAEVFSRYFVAMSDACEWMDIALKRERNKYTPRVLVAPTEIRLSRKFLLMGDEELLATVENPMWLRESA